MKLGINRIETYDPTTRKINQDFEFNENGEGRYVVELTGTDKALNIIKGIICHDIVTGKLGTNTWLYTWLNKPEKIQNGKCITKKNYRIL